MKAKIEVPKVIEDDPGQAFLFDNAPSWMDEWVGMPSYAHEDLQPKYSVIVHFRNRDDIAEFSKAIGQNVYNTTRSVWYPEAEIGRYANKKYVSSRARNPRYPVYIISKGRWESRLTAKSLDSIDVYYRIVVEPQEYDEYAKVIDSKRILVLPFSNKGTSVPARNWVWEHAKERGAKRHWILDDNINGFYRYQGNLKTPVGDGTIFRCAEDFVDRYDNVGLAGFHYFMFVSRKSGSIPPYYLNTRCYSCILIDNSLEHRWRGRYNEDTDLSLRVLKDGYCTVLFNAFLCGKSATMTMKGGNTESLYQGSGRYDMAESLQKQHPDVVKITQKWGRYQHHVDYSPFKSNQLNKVVDTSDIDDPNDYGMTLIVNE